jgi:hypothetical protein
VAAKFDRTYLWLIAPFAAALVSIIQVWPVLPAVMQDEYVYSIQARFTSFEEQTFPNYLFSWIYSSTNLCGDGFYACGKGLNVVFFFLTLAFIFLIAKKLLGVFWGVAIATVAALSPIHVYVSYFMPEMMFFAFILATIFVALIAGEKHKIVLWAATGAILGLAALVKPHAIFTLPAFMLFAWIVALRAEGGNPRKGALAMVGTLGAFSLLKFGGGFAFAGVTGLTLFGRTYESSLNQFISESAAADLKAQTVTNLGNTPVVAVAAEAEAAGPGFGLCRRATNGRRSPALRARFGVRKRTGQCKWTPRKTGLFCVDTAFVSSDGVISRSLAGFLSDFSGDLDL